MSGIGDAVEVLYWFSIFSFFVLLPLSIWKLIDICIYLYSHISFN